MFGQSPNFLRSNKLLAGASGNGCALPVRRRVPHTRLDYGCVIDHGLSVGSSHQLGKLLNSGCRGSKATLTINDKLSLVAALVVLIFIRLWFPEYFPKREPFSFDDHPLAAKIVGTLIGLIVVAVPVVAFILLGLSLKSCTRH
jgi:hypothetical protein